ncbi:MAG TPA: DUF3313 domain-containing protein [Methylomirabilota bacterium]|nr:DUF3313 domain-containing protein [Methylomirabilota bacterium]
MNTLTSNNSRQSRNGALARGMLALAGLLLVAIATSGCKTKAAPNSGFLQDSGQMGEDRSRFPFQRVWVKPGVKKENYDFVNVAPVNTSYLMNVSGWKAANPGNADLDYAVRDLAEYTRATFVEAFNRPQNNRFRVTPQPAPRSVVLELAITELVPSKAALTAAGMIAPAAGQAAVGVGAKVAAGQPSVAIEGRVRDASTGEVLFQFADRQEPQMRVVNVQGLTWWSHAKEAIRDWAAQCVQLANTPADQKVEDRLPFTLKPWSN